jgi:hypothetical protein
MEFDGRFSVRALSILILSSTLSVWVSSAKPFLDLQFDLKLSKPPKECRKQDHRGHCVLAYAISLLESYGDFDLQAVMLQEGHVTQLSGDRKKHFREDTVVAIPSTVRANQDSHLFVGVKFYGLSHNVQDYFVLDATKLVRHSGPTKTLAAIDTDDLSFVAMLRRGKMSHDLAGTSEVRTCGCQGYNCGCCAHLDIAKIELNETGCVNLTYLPHEYGIAFTLSLDGRLVYNSTISARNPPPVCFGVPYLKEYASLCVRFYDLDVSQQSFYGCVKLEAELYHVRVAERELGCFHLGPLESSSRHL